MTAPQGAETFNITAFDTVVQHEFQQMTSKLYPYVKQTTLNANQMTIDGMGSVEMKEAQARYAPIVFDQVDHTRRGVNRIEYAVDLPIDAKDARAILENQAVEYAKVIVAAAQRQIDRIISGAFFADITLWTTNSDGVSVPFATPLTFANDGGETIDAKAGLTYPILVKDKRIFVNNDVDLDNNTFVFAGTGDEMDALMNEDKFINSFYTKQTVVDNGNITQASGYKTLFFSSGASKPVIGLDSSGFRECATFIAQGITLAVNKEVTITLKDRADLRNVQQVSAILSMGAVRNKAGVVHKIQTTVKT
jgi:hypothetical protein